MAKRKARRSADLSLTRPNRRTRPQGAWRYWLAVAAVVVLTLILVITSLPPAS